MKKLTKSSLEELAQTMPVLTEQEQSSCIGGGIYIIDKYGHFVGMQSSETAHGLLISGIGPHGSGVYTDLDSGVLLYQKKYDIEESGVVVGQRDALSFEGPDVNLELFKFLADNTEAVWGMSYNEDGSGGYLDTTYQDCASSHLFNSFAYDSFVHNHEDGTGANGFDLATFDKLSKPNENGDSYENFSIYNEKSGQYEEYKKINGEWVRG